MSNEWREVIAALANEDARQLYAEIVLDLPDASTRSSKKCQRALAALASAGLVQGTENGTYEPTAARLTELLADAAEPRKVGIGRFIEQDRIQSSPAKPALRRELLAWVASTALARDDELTEPELGERLARYHDDVATLRRYLVDAGFLLRSRSGTGYSRA